MSALSVAEGIHTPLFHPPTTWPQVRGFPITIMMERSGVVPRACALQSSIASQLKKLVLFLFHDFAPVSGESTVIVVGCSESGRVARRLCCTFSRVQYCMLLYPLWACKISLPDKVFGCCNPPSPPRFTTSRRKHQQVRRLFSCAGSSGYFVSSLCGRVTDEFV